MKRIVYSVFCCMVVLFLTACNNDTLFRESGEASGSNRIILGISSGKLASKVVSQGVETAVKHLDVLIFTDQGGKPDSRVHYERVSGTADAIVLGAERKGFGLNQKYWVYLIANSKVTESDMAEIKIYTDLTALRQEDPDIHLTGIAAEEAQLPQQFLMDGVAYLKPNANVAEPVVPSAVVLYDGIESRNTELGVVLRRAAAKVVINIHQGAKVTFAGLEGESARYAGYYLRNMPYSTSLVPVDNYDAHLRKNTEFVISDYSRYDEVEKKITVTAYMYSHRWKGGSSLDKEPRMIVGIPLTYKKDETTAGEFKEKNYYQIPLSRSGELKRNFYYEVDITVNAPGGEDQQEPVELADIRYRVEDWSDIVAIDVGGEMNHPKYLTVNKKDMEMYNTTVDNTTLQFTSSSAVKVEMVEAYYFDKFGQKQTVSSSIQREIKLIPDSELAGNIKIQSPLPTNNTIRYIRLKVTNQDGVQPKEVLVVQYPLEYITNIQGWYSYRSDFGGTNWETLNGLSVDGKGKVKVDKDNRILTRTVGCSWSNGRWTYSNTGNNANNFTSKVATLKSGGKSTISFYSWKEEEYGHYKYPTINWGWIVDGYEYTPREVSAIGNLDNARMYHVRITASSGDYTVGVPQMTAEGITAPGADNAKLVSPSFMIASQLGAVAGSSFQSVEQAASHCKEYVEVYKDESGRTVHLDDWRLPTAAELKIIMRFQNTSGSAIDKVLTGGYYWSASGPVRTEGVSNSDYAIRCVRDAYKKPKGK